MTKASAELPLSVVVCTYERAESLVRFLESLRAQEALPQQVVIIDASVSDETQRRIGQLDKTGLGRKFIYRRVVSKHRLMGNRANCSSKYVGRLFIGAFEEIVADEGRLSDRCTRVRQGVA